SAGAHQDPTDVLVTETELDLLERPLDQERRERVHDRPHPGKGQAGSDVHRERLADADVDDPGGVSSGLVDEVLAANLREHHGDAWIALDQVDAGAGEPLAHVERLPMCGRQLERAHDFSSTSATTTFGPFDGTAPKATPSA